MRRGIGVLAAGVALLVALLVGGAPDATGQAAPAVESTEVPLSVQARQRAAEHPELAEAWAALADATEAGSDGRGAEEGSPTITATPATGLVHEQTVTVRGAGRRAREELFIIQCAPGPFTFTGCEILSDFQQDLPRTGANGRFTAPEDVEVILDTPDGAVDCRLVTCRVGVVDLSGQLASFVDIAFDPGGPDPTRYTVAGTPDTGLVDGDIVTVTGSGFPLYFDDFGIALVTPCRTPVTGAGDCDFGETEYVEVGATGALSGRVYAAAILNVDGGPHDCRAGTCALLVQPESFVIDGSGELSEAGLVSIAFDPGGALRPLPTLTADPNTGLVDGDAVELTASGFDPNRGFTIQQCRAGATTSADCRSDLLSFGAADSSDFTFFMSLRTRFRDHDGALVDCRVTACSVVVAHGDLGRHAEALTEFDPGGSLLEPTLSVTPSTGLADGDDVSVTGSGWPEGELIIVVQCPATALNSFGCGDTSTYVNTPPSNFEALPVARTRAEAIETAGFSVTLPVHTVLLTEFGRVDCHLEPCVVAAESFGDDGLVRAAISFRVDQGPIPATPAFTG